MRKYEDTGMRTSMLTIQNDNVLQRNTRNNWNANASHLILILFHVGEATQ